MRKIDRLRNRREFLGQAGWAAAAALCAGTAATTVAGTADRPFVSINQWAVGAIRGRDKQAVEIGLDDELAGLASAGIDGLEPSLSSADQVDALVAKLAKHGLQIRSIYTGSAVDDPTTVARESQRIMALAKRVREAGAEIIVTNPRPLPNRQGKSDEQLRTQAAALNELGHALAALGVRLAYHNHDVELQHAAREFHHMMIATDPEALSLCLDAHWVYRGAGNSQVALFDVLELYGSRVIELHLRQSTDNIWSETFGDGDIDYRAIARRLAALDIRPLLVLEQGPERETPQTLEIAEVHRRSADYARQVFAASGKAAAD